MGLEKILPKWTSFLPGGLALNTGDLVLQSFERKFGIAKDEPESSRAKGKRGIGFITECFRDIPTMALLYYGGKELGLAYYAGATWLMDRWAYIGCPGQ